jgi:hypothetical protein
MLARSNLLVLSAVLLSTSLAAPAAWAQDEGDKKKPAEEGATDDAGTPKTEEADQAKKEGDVKPLPPGQEPAVDEALEAGSPVEQPGKTYYFVGLRYRGIIVPKFMENLFGDGGRAVWVHSVGPEFGVRKDGFEYDFSVWYADYAMAPTPFKASNDPDVAWEIVESKISVMFFTADFLWSHEFSPEVALNYGMGAGFGIVWGDLKRTQAYPPGNTTDPYAYEPCTAVGNPRADYCGGDNDHYGGYTEPSWADGGSKPVIYPWLTLQTGLRFKPHKNFVGRLDLGFGTSGFLLGIGADYGI